MNRPFLPSVLQNAIPLVLAVVLAACTTPPAPVVPAPTEQIKAPATATATLEPTATFEPTATLEPTLPPEDAGIFHLRATLPVDAFYFRPVWVNNGSGLAAHLTGEGDTILFSTGDWAETMRYTPAAGETVLDLSPDGLTIARTLDLSTVELVDIASNTVLHTIQQASGSYPVVSFSPDGEYLAVGNWQEALVADIYRVRDGSLLWTLSGFSTAAPVYHFTFVEGMRLLWASRAHAQVMDAASGAMGAPLLHEDFISAEAINPAGRQTATAAAGMVNGEYTPLIFLWDGWSGEQLATIPTAKYVASLDYSPDGTLLAAAVGGTVQIWDPQTLTLLGTLTTTAETVTGLAFSPDGTWLASAASDGNLYVWSR